MNHYHSAAVWYRYLRRGFTLEQRICLHSWSVLALSFTLLLMLGAIAAEMIACYLDLLFL